MQEIMIKKATELLQNGTVNRVIGWKAGAFSYDISPEIFTTTDSLKDFVYDDFASANVSKYLIKESRKEGKILAFLKPCDTYSFNQLCNEHRIIRENVYLIGVPCDGKADIEKIKANGVDGVLSIVRDGENYKITTLYGESSVNRKDVLEERCLVCNGKKLVAFDEVLGENSPTSSDADRFELVEKLENMTPDERYEFWRGELSKCIRCNACRNVCPACSCRKCVFDSTKFDAAKKANTDSFEEKMFHIIRAFHVAGRCTDCGECSRVCPQGIRLHLFNRKFIKDINELYGEYQAGADTDSKGPLTNFTFDDAEPSIVSER